MRQTQQKYVLFYLLIIFAVTLVYTSLRRIQNKKTVLTGQRKNIRRLSLYRNMSVTSTNTSNVINNNVSSFRKFHTHDAPMKAVGIAICTLSKSDKTWGNIHETPFYIFFLKSIYHTTQADRKEYNITIHVGVDTDDLYWIQYRNKIIETASSDFAFNLTVHNYAKHQNNKLPFNALMRDAASTGAEYLVRLNDDTEILTSGWILNAVQELASFNPKNIGVVGPVCLEGNTKIMTHDMVHRTHLDIFETYYPDFLMNWYIDDWISAVYGSYRTRKIQDWRVRHHVEYGTRYTPSSVDPKDLQSSISVGVKKIENFIRNQKTEIYVENPSLRLIVLTMNRANSLLRLLKSLRDADYLGDRVALDIWIDISANGTPPDKATLDIARGFTWRHGVKTVHVQPEPAGLRRQWIDTWNLSVPGGLHSDTRERALILEDDQSVSRVFWWWLKAAHNFYANYTEIAGFTLQRASLCAKKCPDLQGGPVPDDTSFLYPLLGTWGYSPRAVHWVRFMHWEKEYQRREKTEKPYVPGTTPTSWYQMFERQGRCPGKHCMWTQLHHYYTWLHDDRFTLYYRAEHGRTLCKNHKEAGLHYSESDVDKSIVDLVPYNNTWKPTFSTKPFRIMLDGKHEINEQHAESDFIRMAISMYKHHSDFIVVMMANQAFLPFIYNWLCNTAHMPLVHDRMLFLFTDESYRDLQSSQFRVNAAKIPMTVDPRLAGDQNYETVGYWRLIELRLGAVLKILKAGIPLLLCEPDALWVTNPLEDVSLYAQTELVAFDNSGVLCGCFLRMRSTANVIAIFSETLQRFSSQIYDTTNLDTKQSLKDEQFILQDLLRDRQDRAYANLTFDMLPASKYVSGRWYDGGVRQDSAKVRADIHMHGTPYVINNNWIIGNSRKIDRMKRWGHWFLQDTEESVVRSGLACVDTGILRQGIKGMLHTMQTLLPVYKDSSEFTRTRIEKYNLITYANSDESTTNNHLRVCDKIDIDQLRKKIRIPIGFESFSDKFSGGGMSRYEKEMLSAVYASGTSVFEWGMGSSSLLAMHLNISLLFSVDSSDIWVNTMNSMIKSHHKTHFRYIDIGPTKAFGNPVNMDSKILWPNYSLAVNEQHLPFDVYLVDGRFRVACACQALLHAGCHSLIVIHDFHRKEYQIISTISRNVIQKETLAVFVVNPVISRLDIERIWEKYKFDPH